LDSSSIVALTREVSETPPDTFSVTFGDPDFCEADYSSRVAREFGCSHHQIDFTESRLLEEIPGAMASMDQPTLDGVNTYIVSQAAKRAGITVALSGLGGDELFAGYNSFISVPRMMKFRRYAGWLWPIGRGIEALLGVSQTSRQAKLIALAGRDYYGDQPYFLSRALFLPGNVHALMPPPSQQSGKVRTDWNPCELEESVRNLDAVNQVAVLEASNYMANTLLRDTDCMSMAHALEVRTPLLHHPLWEYVLPLAGKLKLDSRLPKPLLLRAAGQRLPEDIYLRRKMGFTLPFERWMQDGLRAELEDEILQPIPEELFPLDPNEVASVWKAFLAGKTSWSRPWALYVLKRWIRRNISENFEDCN
jgi:asparagine synthase (glutamine-hydrolysing)